MSNWYGVTPLEPGGKAQSVGSVGRQQTRCVVVLLFIIKLFQLAFLFFPPIRVLILFTTLETIC
jgi:hypothetical protein